MKKNQIENKTDLIMVMNDWTNHHQTKEWIDYCISIGYQYYEIQMLCLPEEDSGQDDVVNYALSKGLKINLHSHYAKNNIIDSDEQNRKKSICQLKQTIDLSARHNLGVVTFHPGRLSSENENVQEKWDMLLETVGHIAEYAKQKKVHIAIENMEKRNNSKPVRVHNTSLVKIIKFYSLRSCNSNSGSFYCFLQSLQQVAL